MQNSCTKLKVNKPCFFAEMNHVVYFSQQQGLFTLSLVQEFYMSKVLISTQSIVGTFPFVYTSFSRTNIISNVYINIPMVTMVVGPIQIRPNEDIKVFNKHQVSDHLHILLLPMCQYINVLLRTKVYQETYERNETYIKKGVPKKEFAFQNFEIDDD